MSYLTLLVLIPLSAVFLKSSGMGWEAFWRVVFPALVPALLTGFSLAFARAVGGIRLRDFHEPFEAEIWRQRLRELDLEPGQVVSVVFRHVRLFGADGVYKESDVRHAASAIS